MTLRQPKPLRLNVGCGSDIREGYVNIDTYASGVDVYAPAHDLPYRSGTVDEIICFQVLEHIPKAKVHEVLLEFRRVLKPGGEVMITVPDLEICMKAWLSMPEDLRWGWSIDTIYGNQNHNGEYHKTGFTKKRLWEVLRLTGFMGISIREGFSHGHPIFSAMAYKDGRPSWRFKPPLKVTNWLSRAWMAAYWIFKG